MAIEDRINAVRSRFDAWQRKIENYFDRVAELLRQFTTLLNEIIIGLTKMVVTLLISSWKLLKEILLLFFLIVPFLLVIPLGIEIGGTIGFIIQLLCGLIAAGLVIFLVIASFVKIESSGGNPDTKITRSKVIFMTVILNVVVMGTYVVLGSFVVPQSYILRPAYAAMSDIAMRITGLRTMVDFGVDPGEKFYTYLRVNVGDHVRFKSSAPMRLVVVNDILTRLLNLFNLMQEYARRHDLRSEIDRIRR